MSLTAREVITLSHVIRKRQGHAYYEQFILHGIGKFKQMPKIEDVLGSEYAEKVVSFSKDEDDKLLEYQRKKLERMKNGSK